MPERRYYEVEQTRIVKVWANNEVDALIVATESFATNGRVEKIDFPGNRAAATNGEIVVTNVNVEREIL